MLSGEGNENGEKQLAKKQLCTCSTLFLYISLPLFCTTTTRNFQKLPGTRFMEELSYVFLFTFFPLSLIFTQVAASISYFLTAATKFNVVPPIKDVAFFRFPFLTL